MEVVSNGKVDAIVYNKLSPSSGLGFYPHLMQTQTVVFEDAAFLLGDETMSRCGWTAFTQADFVLTGATPGGPNTCPAGPEIPVTWGTPSTNCGRFCTCFCKRKIAL